MAGYRSGSGGGGGSGLLQEIERIELLAPAATIVFSSIPQTFTSLLLVTALRTDDTVGQDTNANLYINGDTTDANYFVQQISGSGGGTHSEAGDYSLNIGVPANIDIATANSFGRGRTLISEYSTTMVIMGRIEGEAEQAGGGFNVVNRLLAKVGGTLTGPITGLMLQPVGGSNFVAGSVATLYGI